MQRFPRSAASVSIAVLATSAIAPTAIAVAKAPPPPARYETRGLLDGLLGIDLGQLLGNLLGTSQQAQLQQLLGILQGGQSATPQVLAPLTDILTRLGAAQGLPADTQQLVGQLTALLQQGGANDPLGAGLLAPVSDLLRQLAATRGLPAVAAQLLDQLADVLDGGGGAGLPIGNLPLDPGLLGGIQSVLDGLLRGQRPTSELLAPIVPLLRELSATPGIPPAIRSLVDQLIDTLQRTTGALDPLVTSQLATVLSLIGNTPGVNTETRSLIERTTTALRTAAQSGGPVGGGGGGGGGTTAPGRRRATARDRAVVKRVTLNGRRTVASVRIACPRSAPATCVTTVSAKLRGKRAVAAKRARVGAGKSKVVRLRVTKAATRALRRSGGKLTVTATTQFGAQRFSAGGAVTVKRLR